MTKPVRFFALLALICLCFSAADAQTWQWAKKAGGAGNNSAGGIDIDANGNSYVAGSFYNSVSLGGITLTNSGPSVYVAKYDVSGNMVWAKVVAGSTTGIYASGVSIDNAGNMAITGAFSGSGTFGTTNSIMLVSAGDYDVFVAKFNIAGNVAWAKRAGGAGVDYSGGISKDASGNLYVTGDFHLSSFSGSSGHIFIAKYDSIGNNPWMDTTMGYNSATYSNGIKTDSLGNSYIVGQFFGALTFDSTTILDAGNVESNIYLAKINPNGTLGWWQKAGAGSGYAGGHAIDIDKAGNSFITGFYRGDISFGTLSLSGQSGYFYDVFIAKADPMGNFIWVNKATGTVPGQIGRGVGIAADNDGSCYVTGPFTSTIIFGPTTLTNSGPDDAFVAKADSEGNFLWAIQCGGPSSVTVNGIKANGQAAFIAGNFVDTLAFNPAVSLIADSTTSNNFVAKLNVHPASVPQIAAHNVSIFPNPAIDEITIKDYAPGIQYMIYDVTGRLVSSGTTGMAKNISVSHLAKGTYFLDLADGNNGRARAKFIKN